MPSLCERLRAETAAAHRNAEQRPFIQALFRGALPREAYVEYLAQLRAVYAALEQGWRRRRAHPALGPLPLEHLARSAAIDVDLRFFTGSEARSGDALRDSTRGYVARLEALTQDEPVRLIGHVYTRYLGDLSGGQLLARRVARYAPEGGGVAFYGFGTEDEVAALKLQLRASLDALPLARDEAEAVLDEANRAFDLSAALLDAVVPGGALRS